MNSSISPFLETVSYAAVRSMKMVPVLSLRSKPASMCDVRAENLLELQGHSVNQ
jgi:hypothetical protein